MLKSLVCGMLRSRGIEVYRIPVGHFSYLDEQTVITSLLSELRPEHRFAVDIAAGDGLTMSNTYLLYRDGWSGLAAECDPQKFWKLARAYADFQSVRLAKCIVTPENVVSLLDAAGAPGAFGFLSLDMDGYDYFVLQALLHHYRPTLICAEINEKIPPPLKFTIRWDPGFAWAGDHCYGQSISQLYELCGMFEYDLVELHYNNAMLVPHERNQRPALNPEQAYQTGYLDRADRKEKFPWNSNFEPVLGLKPDDALKWVAEFFEDHAGEFDLRL